MLPCPYSVSDEKLGRYAIREKLDVTYPTSELRKAVEVVQSSLSLTVSLPSLAARL